MIKALFFDLDGTLLTSSKRISNKTMAALKICRQNGINVFTATSRPPLLSRMLNLSPDELEVLQDGGIFCNGGCICLNGEKRYTFLKEQASRKSIGIITKYNNANMAIQMKDEIHSFRYPLTDREYAQWGLSCMIPFDHFEYSHMVKLVVFSPWELLPDLCCELEDAVGGDANIYLTGRNDFKSIEIVDKSINKKLAVEKVTELCGFSHDEVAVFGDDYNDLEMLKGFRHSIAMGNACSEAKVCASHVTLGNDKDGIYYALSNIINLI